MTLPNSIISNAINPLDVITTTALATPLTAPGQLTPAAASSLLFVDVRVSDYQQLVAGAQPGTEIHVLDCAQDAIGQITDTLWGRSGIAAIHILSHGQAGELNFASGTLSLANLSSYTNQLKSWQQALTAGADILLYGCDVAQDASGQAFVSIFSQLTGADVAASNNLTGNAILGGDWTLEYYTGSIEAGLGIRADALAGYQFILPAGDLDLTFGGGTGKVISPAGTGEDFGNSVVIDASGRIVVAGYTYSNFGFALALHQRRSSGYQLWRGHRQGDLTHRPDLRPRPKCSGRRQRSNCRGGRCH